MQKYCDCQDFLVSLKLVFGYWRRETAQDLQEQNDLFYPNQQLKRHSCEEQVQEECFVLLITVWGVE